MGLYIIRRFSSKAELIGLIKYRVIISAFLQLPSSLTSSTLDARQLMIKDSVRVRN